MSGRGINALPLPLERFDVGKLDPKVINFETTADATRENRLRIRRSKVAKKAGLKKTGRLRRLWRSQKKSLASATAMRDLRRIVVSSIWKLLHDAGLSEVSTVTLIPRKWVIPAGKLGAVDPRKLIRQVRAELYRCGARDAKGFVIGFLHGEYDPGSDTFTLHLHLIVSGEMREVVDRLKGRRNYRHRDANGRKLKVKGVRRSRQRLSNMPAPITYLLQPFWPSRWKGIADDGRSIRQRGKSRIPDPRHTELLMWLDRWSLAEITLSIRLRAGRDGLRLSD